MRGLKKLITASMLLALGLAVLIAGAFLLVPGLRSDNLFIMLNVAIGFGVDTPEDVLLERLRAPAGYTVTVFARAIGNPRMLLRTPSNRLLVSSPRSGEVILLSDSDSDGSVDEQRALLGGLTRPHGIDFHGDHLYVAESDQIGRIRYDDRTGNTSGDYEVLVDGLTDDGRHWSKTLRFDAAGWMYLAQGSSCDVCMEVDERRATIMRFRADGSEGTVYASGLRNSVGMDFAPWNGALYATDNGRGHLGDEKPPCELNLITADGFYGWPYLNGNNELDPDFGAGKESLQSSSTRPSFEFEPHNAPLGIHFADSIPRTALVALHGSVDRVIPDGYKVVALHWSEDGSISASDFLWGFLLDGDVIGRPVDVTGDGNGGFFVSDDYARVIYRVSTRADIASVVPEEGLARPIPLAPIEIDPEQAQAGELLFRRLPCLSCHGPESATPVVLNDLRERYDLASLTEFLDTPTPPMPRFGLSEAERLQLAHYLLGQE